jgi:tetratricopeptide (TPR) repeat protein
VIAAAALAACRLVDPGLDAYAGKPWVEVRSNTFRVLSDAGLEQAQAFCGDAELFRAVVAKVTTARRADLRVPATIFVFESPAGVSRFADRRSLAGAVLPSMRDSLALAFAGKRNEMDGRAVLFHEYMHLVMRNESERIYPLWYDEGLAELFATMRIEPDRVVVGEFPDYRKHAAARRDDVPIRRVVAARGVEGWSPITLDTLYFQSWLLTHYLTLGPGRGQPGGPSGLSRYLALEAPPGGEEAAWEAAFGTDFDRLEGKLVDYGANSKIPLRAIPRESLAPQACDRTRTLPPAEAASELGWLAVRLGRPEPARELFASALRSDPNESRAHAGLGDVTKFAGRFGEARPHYDRALALAPQDYQNHLELAEWAIDLPPEHGGGAPETVALAREHLETALRLAPACPEAHAMLGRTYAFPGQDAKLGIPHAQRAAQLLPSNEQIQLVLAELYLRSGEAAAARRRLERLVALSHPTLGGEAARLLAQLDAGGSAPGDGHLRDPQRGGGGGAEP